MSLYRIPEELLNETIHDVINRNAADKYANEGRGYGPVGRYSTKGSFLNGAPKSMINFYYTRRIKDNVKNDLNHKPGDHTSGFDYHEGNTRLFARGRNGLELGAWK